MNEIIILLYKVKLITLLFFKATVKFFHDMTIVKRLTWAGQVVSMEVQSASSCITQTAKGSGKIKPRWRDGVQRAQEEQESAIGGWLD